MDSKISEIIKQAKADRPEQEAAARTGDTWLVERFEHTHWREGKSDRKGYYGHFVTEGYTQPGSSWTGCRILFYAKHPVLAMREIVASDYDPVLFAHRVLN